MKEFAYALDDKLTSLTYANEVNSTPDVTYNYGTPADPYGRLQSVLDGTGTTIYGYHPIGAPGALKVASIDGPDPGTTDKIEYGYDAIGLVTNRKLNGAANEVNYKFDSLGRLRSQVTPIGTFTFGYVGVTGRRLDLVYPNGQRVDYTYHPGLGDHRLQEIPNKLPSGSTLSKFTYTYDPVATINTWSQQRGPGVAQTYDFTYDAADQLRFATPLGPSLPSYEYTYDDVGNREQHIVDAAVLEAAYDDRNRILEYGPPGGTQTLFSHDDSGNMTVKGSQGYTWDAEYRLLSVNGFAPVLFQYDAQRRRSSKTAAGVNRKYIYDGARLLEERVTGGSSIKYFDGPGIDEHLAKQDSTGAITYFASDHLGSVTDHTSSAGTITLTRKYDPWGNLLTGSTTSGPAFTGRDWDAETGLYYYRARYYDPKIGRFLSEDPIHFLAGPNFYAYVGNDPINQIDPYGLDPLIDDPDVRKCICELWKRGGSGWRNTEAGMDIIVEGGRRTCRFWPFTNQVRKNSRPPEWPMGRVVAIAHTHPREGSVQKPSDPGDYYNYVDDYVVCARGVFKAGKGCVEEKDKSGCTSQPGPTDWYEKWCK